MPNSDLQPRTSGPVGAGKASPRHFHTANEAAIDTPVIEAVGFDPRNSFYPQTLLKAEDLRVSMPRPAPKRPRYIRFAKVFVGVVLAIGAAVTYVAFLAPSAPGPVAKDAEPANAGTPKSSTATVGTIGVPAASATPAVAKLSTTDTAKATPAAYAPSHPAPAASPPAAPPKPAVARAPAAVAAAPSLPAGPRSTVTHTKAALEGGDTARFVEPAAAPPPATVGAPAPQAPPARPGTCVEAVAALGLCTPSKGN